MANSGQTALLIAIIAIALAVIGIGSPASKSQSFTPLGVWKNMPSAATELMGNTSYRGVLETGSATGEAGILAGLTVGCVTPSNTALAALQLQYANFSRSTNLNTSNFANIVGAMVFIDNSANSACPGNLGSGNAALPSINGNPVDFIFRVVGSGGGGSGDNPRFSSVSVLLSQLGRKDPLVVIGASSTTTFTYQAHETFPVSVATTVTIKWQATNVTTTGCGVFNITFLTEHCWEAGTSSATVAIGGTASPTTTVTFTTAFTGTVQVVASATGAGGVITMPVGTISLLTAQTLTV